NTKDGHAGWCARSSCPRFSVTESSVASFVRAAGRRAIILGAIAIAAMIASVILQVSGATGLALFVATAVALASLAAVVGEATDQLGTRLGPGATGVVQSALGNLPELFISIFALRAGLVVVVQTALIGSILANSLLVLGLAFAVGGWRHGTLRFGTDTTRMTAMLLVLSVASLAIPTLATAPGAPDFGHARALSIITSIVLLAVFASSIPMAVKGTIGPSPNPESARRSCWPLSAAVIVLALAGVGAAVMSDWFVEALRPAMALLHLSEEFVGLVIVAIAGNAVENVVGIAAAARNDGDLAVSLILNSSLGRAPPHSRAGAHQRRARRTSADAGGAGAPGHGTGPGGGAGCAHRVRWRVELRGGAGAGGAVRHHCRQRVVRPGGAGLIPPNRSVRLPAQEDDPGEFRVRRALPLTGGTARVP